MLHDDLQRGDGGLPLRGRAALAHLERAVDGADEVEEDIAAAVGGVGPREVAFSEEVREADGNALLHALRLAAQQLHEVLLDEVRALHLVLHHARGAV